MNNNVQVIKASVTPRDRRKLNQLGELRVGAYCRVSTDTEDQLNSYNSQVKYYTDLINSKKEWTLVDIYADEGITGTQVGKRENFQRMINDCASGKVDLIITKSISRFARNTLDTLQYVRKLKERNIAVFFEDENINTLTMDGELLLTILSSVAQQEVENISANVKKGLKMKMQRGELIGFKGCLGYDYDPNTKELVVNEEEAEIVRFIFRRYTAGIGTFKLAKELKEKGFKTKVGSNNWAVSTIINILRNEKYKGDLMLGKTFTIDPIYKKKAVNNGEVDKFYIKNHHEPIIEASVFDYVQTLIDEKSGPRKEAAKNSGRETSKYPFSKILYCGCCGGKYHRRAAYESNKARNAGWQCNTAAYKGKANCPDSRFIEENLLETAFVYAINQIRDTNLIDEFLYTVKCALSNKTPERKADELLKDIKVLENKKKQLIDIRMEGILTKEDFEEQYKELNDKVEKKKALLSRASSEIDKKEFIASRLEDFKKIISIKNGTDEFDREIFEMLVDKVIIGGYDEQGNPDPYAIEFRFKIDYNFKINGQAIKKKYTVCQNESNDLGSLTTYCQVHSVQVLQNLQSHSVHTLECVYKSSDL